MLQRGRNEGDSSLVWKPRSLTFARPGRRELLLSRAGLFFLFAKRHSLRHFSVVRAAEELPLEQSRLLTQRRRHLRLLAPVFAAATRAEHRETGSCSVPDNTIV